MDRPIAAAVQVPETGGRSITCPACGWPSPAGTPECDCGHRLAPRTALARALETASWPLYAAAVVALLAVLTFETLEALLISVIVSLFALVWRASHPKLAVLGRAPDSLQFSDVRRHPENLTMPGLLIVRPENGLFFANAAGMREAIIAEMTSSTEPVKAVLLDLGATTDLDVPTR